MTHHASDALDKCQITSCEQKEAVSKILKNESTDVKPKAPVPKTPSPVPSLELCVSNASKSPKGPFNCSCKRQSFNLGDGDQLTKMIQDLVSKYKSGKAKIKLEIEFSD